MIDVVAGVILSPDGEQVLLALRHAHQHQGGRWEFPGGKVEPGEALAAALIRELIEEIAIEPVCFAPFMNLEHHYPERAVRLHVFRISRFTGTPSAQEGQALQWVPLAKLGGLPFPEANAPIVSALLDGP